MSAGPNHQARRRRAQARRPGLGRVPDHPQPRAGDGQPRGQHFVRRRRLLPHGELEPLPSAVEDEAEALGRVAAVGGLAQNQEPEQQPMASAAAHCQTGVGAMARQAHEPAAAARSAP